MRENVCKYGIDLGTSNSSIALMHYKSYEAKADIECFEIYYESSHYLKEVLPSIVCYRDNNPPVVGHDAKQEHVSRSDNYNTLFTKVKLDVLEENCDVKYPLGINNYIYASDILSVILSTLKERAEDKTDDNVNGAVVGVPVGAKDGYKHVILKSLQKAGFYKSYEEAFANTEFMAEPVAVALNYKLELDTPQTILIFDFGGGTLDLVFAEIYPDKTSKVLSKIGIKLGGEKLTELFLKNYFVDKIGLEELAKRFKFYNITNKDELWIALEKTKDGLAFIDRVDMLKIALSRSEKQTFSFKGVETKAEINIADVTRKDFEASIEGIVQEIRDCVNNCFKNSGLKLNQINSVYMSGGSSLIPCIQDLLKSAFGAKVQPVDGTALTCIARGLAIQGFRNYEDEVYINDISEFNYGVWDSVKDSVSVIIKKGDNISETKIDRELHESPYSKQYRLSSKNISIFNIEVYQDNEKMGDIQMNDVGSGYYTIFFEIDNKNGFLKISIYDRYRNKWYDDIPLQDRTFVL